MIAKGRNWKRTTLTVCLSAAMGWAMWGEPAIAQQDFAAAVPDAAKKAVARRQERVAQADSSALSGQRLMAQKDYEGAVTEFRAALDLLPEAVVVEDRREEYTAQYAEASVLLARQRAEEGRYDEAIELVQNVLDPGIDPENLEARRLLEDLNNPEIYSTALTPEHIARVKRVEQALQEARSFIDLGDYDNAENKYHEALNFDRYNSSARVGLQDVEKMRRNYLDTAYDQTRATFLRQVSEQWELQAPRLGVGDGLADLTGPLDRDDGVAYIQEKLKRIIIPELEFDDTTLRDAVAFLRQKSIDLDDIEPDPTRKGVNMIIRGGTNDGAGAGAAAPAAGGDADLGFGDAGGFGGGFSGGSSGGPTISLQLSNVPLVEALRYTTELARRKFKVEPNAVVIIPLTESNEDLFTQVFRVPPNFLSADAEGGGGGGSDDPFAALGDDGGGGSSLTPRAGAREILESRGVTFGPGTSAIYQPTTSQLIVRNTQDQIDLIEAYVDSLRENVQQQIYITSKFVEINQEDNDVFGFDWLIGQSNLGGSNRIFTSGGTVGSSRPDLNNSDFPFVPPTPQGATANPSPVGNNLVTSSLRTGTLAVAENSIDALLNETTAGLTNLSPATFALAGVFTDPEFQVVLRAVSQHKGTDLLSAPSVVARSGQRALIEVIREFIYPEEYDPPEIPDNFGGGGGGQGGTTIITTFPVTPANPAAFTTRNVGVTLEVDPVIGADGFTIDLNLNPEVVEFEGFINYGSPIFTTSLVGTAVQLTANRIEMPVFATRRVTTSVTIWDGQTVAVGGLIREDIQLVQDKIPLLGDIPAAGFFFRTETEVHNKKNLTVFVTANLIDPAGVRINKPEPNVVTPDGGF